MEPFERLSNIGKARRLRSVAFAALERYDLDIRRVRLVTNEFNALFRVDTASGRTFALRVNLPRRRSLDEIRAEMAWLRSLANETKIGVPAPFPSRDGDLVVTAEAPGVPEPRHCVVFEWVQGVDLAARMTDENISGLGELTAQLHEHARTFEAPRGLRLWNTPFPFDDEVVLLGSPLVTPRARATLVEALARIEDALGRLRYESPLMIHADLHQDNVRVYGRRLFVLDFDDSILGYPVQDIGATFWNLQAERSYRTLCEAFRRGYERRGAWPEHEPGEVEVFAANRALMLIEYALKDPDPEELVKTPAFVLREVRHLQRWLDR